jgi:GNAT superfamily N-acetyltransferase
LGEFLEQLGLLLGCHADAGIGHSDLDPVAVVDHLFDAQLDIALLGELTGIAQEIEQDLPWRNAERLPSQPGVSQGLRIEHSLSALTGISYFITRRTASVASAGLVVSTHHRGRGIGEKLVQASRSRVRSIGLTRTGSTGGSGPREPRSDSSRSYKHAY